MIQSVGRQSSAHDVGGCQYGADMSEQPTATAADFDDLRPVLLVEHMGSSHSIIYSPGGPEYPLHRAALEANGVEGNGYEFSGALQAALADADPAALGKVNFDPEAGMMSVYGPDLDALLVAARHLHRLITDNDALDAALKRAAELGYGD